METDRDPPDAGAAPGRRWMVLGAAVALLAALLSATALHRGGHDGPSSGLSISWGGSEGHPSCGYDPGARSVACTITIDGEVSEPGEITVTVTAYADENTSSPVGSASRTVQVEGAMQSSVVVTIPVEKAPHVDEDGETACRLAVSDSKPGETVLGPGRRSSSPSR